MGTLKATQRMKVASIADRVLGGSRATNPIPEMTDAVVFFLIHKTKQFHLRLHTGPVELRLLEGRHGFWWKVDVVVMRVCCRLPLALILSMLDSHSIHNVENGTFAWQIMTTRISAPVVQM